MGQGPEPVEGLTLVATGRTIQRVGVNALHQQMRAEGNMTSDPLAHARGHEEVGLRVLRRPPSQTLRIV